jgi:hypothetical protein
VDELKAARWQHSPRTDADGQCEFRYQPEGWGKKWIGGVPDRTAFTAEEYRTGPFLNSTSECCAALYEAIFAKEFAPAGLVVITGTTGSGKSTIVRGLIDLYLRNPSNIERWYDRERVPHLVTYEDPIESLLYTQPETDLDRRWLDYTPRQKKVDVKDLRNAIACALRQTPAAFYVGEVRDINEWMQLLEFAGTGHLIFTTAHAGSLVEAMGKIFGATRAMSAARRAIVADRLLALVHLRLDRIAAPWTLPNGIVRPFAKNVAIPALWHRTVNGAMALMAEGQSSLLPHTVLLEHLPDGRVLYEPQSCFGRTWFAERLWTEAVEQRMLSELGEDMQEQLKSAGYAVNVKTCQEDARIANSAVRRLLRDKCTEWDLEGL